MHPLDLTADQVISALLAIAETEPVCVLDSCGVGHLGSHLLIAGIEPVDAQGITNQNVGETLAFLDSISTSNLASIFTISYDFGMKLQRIPQRHKLTAMSPEPDIYVASFDVLVVHDYESGQTFLTGDAGKFLGISRKLRSKISDLKTEISDIDVAASSNFTKGDYLAAIETIKERIRRGDTYQTNLTQQLTVKLSNGVSPAAVFSRLRSVHPAPFSSFVQRQDSTVISASPERFFRVESNPAPLEGSRKTIRTSPIKGTRPRGPTIAYDNAMRSELRHSPKDRAENTMIVDLLRNDLGRICEYGSVKVEKLCDLEEHPTLFHLVSTVSGTLREKIQFSDILRAVFPCGSITGAPKLSTMRIIDEIETTDRGLSMGAIGYSIPPNFADLEPTLDLNVAIRTMVIRDDTATFNVGGGIVIDSDPEKEYEESLLKAKALLTALGVRTGSIEEAAN
ncbi:MAG: anthranilate synthase component I family protein [Pyrinomonadaceae bacterium]